ncbi:MAG: Na+:solute symporter [Bacteroidia bacterium]|nr:Na+:solute symporter [Bacteroidia bacterium]
MRRFVAILFIFFLVSCSVKEHRDILAEKSQEFLVQTLENSTRWEKIHAAEELLALGYAAGIKEQFTKELGQYADTPQYRIGIWRVLAREARTDSERKMWIDEMARVYADTSQPDRLHAAESLAKLNVNLREIAPGLVGTDLAGSDTLMQAFVLWGSSVAANRDSTDYRTLMSMVESPVEIFRKIGAYALGFCPGLPQDYRSVLSEKAVAEPETSRAKVYLLKAAFLFPAGDSTSTSLKMELSRFLSSSQKYARVEAALALAERGTEDDLMLLEEVFENKGSAFHFNENELADIRAASAYAILRITQRTGGGMALPDWLILVAYAFLMLGIGFFYSKKNKDAEDYHLGGRSMNPVLVGLSLFATILSTLSYLSYPGEMVKYGPVIFTSLISFPVVYFIVGWLLIPRFMKMRVTSAYEILEIKIGPGVRILGTFFFLSLRLLWMATIIYATVNTAIISIFGIQKSFVPLICLIMAVITVIYTSMGGLKAVVITDSLQTVILILGALLTLFIIAIHLGSFQSIFPDKMPDHWEQITWGLDAGKRMTVGNAILMVFVWYICTAGSDQMAIQRYLATKDVRSARKTFRISVITNFLVQSLLAVVGLALLAYFTKKPYELPAGETIFTYADSLFPWFIVIGLPVGVTGLVTAGLISAAMSSLSSGLNSSSSVISEDIMKRFFPSKGKGDYLKQARIISVIIGGVVTLLCLLVGYVQGNLLEVVIKVVNLFVAPLFVLFFMALFIPFATQKATIAGGLVSVATAIAIAFFEVFGLKVLWIMPVAFIVGISVACFISAFDVFILKKLNTNQNEKMEN